MCSEECGCVPCFSECVCTDTCLPTRPPCSSPCSPLHAYPTPHVRAYRSNRAFRHSASSCSHSFFHRGYLYYLIQKELSTPSRRNPLSLMPDQHSFSAKVLLMSPHPAPELFPLPCFLWLCTCSCRTWYALVFSMSTPVAPKTNEGSFKETNETADWKSHWKLIHSLDI